jgi:hypothetical protein
MSGSGRLPENLLPVPVGDLLIRAVLCPLGSADTLSMSAAKAVEV